MRIPSLLTNVAFAMAVCGATACGGSRELTTQRTVGAGGTNATTDAAAGAMGSAQSTGLGGTTGSAGGTSAAGIGGGAGSSGAGAVGGTTSDGSAAASQHGCNPGIATDECGGAGWSCTPTHVCCAGFGSDCGFMVAGPDSGIVLGSAMCTSDEMCPVGEYCQDARRCCPIGYMCDLESPQVDASADWIANDGPADGAAQVCDAGRDETLPSSCPEVCLGDACGGSTRYVFSTSVLYAGGLLGGLEGADAKCQALARAAQLPGNYMAWLSDATGSPATRFSHQGGPYILVNGDVVADNWSALTTSRLRHAINLTESGGRPPIGTGPCPGAIVWTDTLESGELIDAALSCNNWSDQTSRGSVWGYFDAQAQWSAFCYGSGISIPQPSCSLPAPIYCFQQ